MEIQSCLKMTKMCQILWVLSLLLCPRASFGQDEKNLFRAEAGIAFCGSGDMYGKVFSLAYMHRVYRDLFISPDFEVAGFKQIVQPNSTISAISYSGSIVLAYRKILSERILFETSLGSCLNQFNWTFVTSSNSMDIKGIEVEPYSQKTYKEKMGVGYLVRIGSAFRLSRSDLGLFYCLQNDTNGNIVHSLRFNITCNFGYL